MENSFLPHHGPIWKTKQCFVRQTIPIRIPNSVNCGPVLNTCTFSPHSQESANNDLVKVCQDPSAKFPLECIKPPLRPLYSDQRSSYSFMPWKARKYYPNVLSSFALNDDEYLIYGENSDAGNCVKLAMIENDNTELKLKYITNLTRYENFHQTDSAMVNGYPMVLLRIDDFMNLFRLNGESFDVYTIPENKMVHCCLNKILDDNLAFSSKDGFVTIYDVVENQSRWRGEFDICKDDFLMSEFGCHPLQMHVASSAKVWFIDSRAKHHVNNQIVFDTNHVFLESICNIKCMPATPYIYVICSESVFLMDTRHSKHPLMKIYHLITNPSYPQSFRINGTDNLFLTNPVKNQICIIPSCWKGTDSSLYIQNFSTPKHFNLTKDTFNYARCNGLFFSNGVEMVLKSPLIGLIGVPSKNQSEISIYLQSHIGNLFYSKFVSPSGMVENSESNDTIGILKKFEEKCCRPRIPISQNAPSVPCIETIFRNHIHISTTGNFKLFKSKTSGKFYSVPSDSIKQPESIKPKLDNLNFPLDSLPKETIGKFDFSFLKTFSDEISTNILSVWNKDLEENFEKSVPKNEEFPSQKFPINLDETLLEKVPMFEPNRSKEASLFFSEKEEGFMPVSPSSKKRKRGSKRQSHVSGF